MHATELSPSSNNIRPWNNVDSIRHWMIDHDQPFILSRIEHNANSKFELCRASHHLLIGGAVVDQSCPKLVASNPSFRFSIFVHYSRLHRHRLSSCSGLNRKLPRESGNPPRVDWKTSNRTEGRGQKPTNRPIFPGRNLL